MNEEPKSAVTMRDFWLFFSLIRTTTEERSGQMRL